MERKDLAYFQIFRVYAYYETVALNLHERQIYKCYINCENSAYHKLILREEKKNDPYTKGCLGKQIYVEKYSTNM